uniref:Uncharacterized protein n=1 Tax=Macaca mulatta TaxID=9544 RepID=A0A5F8AN43_MACMU
MESCLFCHVAGVTGVWLHNLGSLQPSPPSLSDSCAAASQVAEITGVHHHTWLIFFFFFFFFFFRVEMGFCHIGQASLEFLALRDLPTLASQSARITGMSYHAWSTIMSFSEWCLFQKQLPASQHTRRTGWSCQKFTPYASETPSPIRFLIKAFVLSCEMATLLGPLSTVKSFPLSFIKLLVQTHP